MWFKWDSFVLFRVYLRFDFRLLSTSYFRLEALYNTNTYYVIPIHIVANVILVPCSSMKQFKGTMLVTWR